MDVDLPLAFFVQIAPPQMAPKDPNDMKINLILTKTAPSAVSLFEDVVECLQARDLCTNKKQMCFIYHNKQIVSLLVSKDDLKIRIQSQNFSSLWFIMNEMVKRLQVLYGSGKSLLVILKMTSLRFSMQTRFLSTSSLTSLTNTTR